jgi:hypothetical protein
MHHSACIRKVNKAKKYAGKRTVKTWMAVMPMYVHGRLVKESEGILEAGELPEEWHSSGL